MKAVVGASAVVWHEPGRLVTAREPADQRCHVPSPARAASCAARAFSARSCPWHRVSGIALGHLPWLTAARADVLVATGIGRPAETDLVPRPRVGVEGVYRRTSSTARRPCLAGIPCQSPIGPHVVDDAASALGRQVPKGRPVSGTSIGVEPRDRNREGVPVFGHVFVAVPVAPALSQALVDHVQHRHPGLAVLGQQPVDQGACRRLLLGRKERAGLRPFGAEPGGAPGDGVPWRPVRLERRTPGTAPRPAWCASPSQRSRRRYRGQQPMPPTSPNSNGANTGGPISAL